MTVERLEREGALEGQRDFSEVEVSWPPELLAYFIVTDEEAAADVRHRRLQERVWNASRGAGTPKENAAWARHHELYCAGRLKQADRAWEEGFGEAP